MLTVGYRINSLKKYYLPQDLKIINSVANEYMFIHSQGVWAEIQMNELVE